MGVTGKYRVTLTVHSSRHRVNLTLVAIATDISCSLVSALKLESPEGPGASITDCVARGRIDPLRFSKTPID